MINEPSVQHPTGAPSLSDLLASRALADLPEALPAAALDGSADLDRYLGSNTELPAPQSNPSAMQEQDGPAPFTPADMGNTLLAARVPLLLVHSGLSEGALVQTWMQHVLKGSPAHIARFQDNVLELAQYHQPHAFLIQFDPHCLDAAVALATQLQALYPQIPRLAIGRIKYAQCMLAALRTGVQDFLDIDASIDAAQQALRHLINGTPAAGIRAPRAPQTAIVSARSGLGCSLLAAHLSWHLQARLTRPAPIQPPHGIAAAPAATNPVDPESLTNLLIELSNPGGDCAIYLNTPGEFSFTDAVSQQRRLDLRMAQSALARHDSGLRLLTLTRQTRAPSSTEVEALLKRLSQYFKHIVLDLGANTAPELLKDVLPSASEVWVVCDQSVASVVWTAELLQQLDALQIDRERMRLIVSRHDSSLELSAQQVARQLQLPLLAHIPERRRQLSQVVNQGMLLAPQQKREPYVQAIEQLVAGLLAEHHPDKVLSPTAPASTLSRLLQRMRRN
ncbi:pilus assembly protein CpaE [Acidovorax sp. Be4]|uniref:Pilus assembly protein CpaE n=1 Tax=Acidovorax bellezanensis TaxID=2976702 RepID=A0ABT2PRH7_9BURK|nr:pilus assembly protein CpaE [Acidovorax sp. Be4]MCT9813075.1 pilus assembly protein CpaE [Acidovorax sp. Be4]